MTSVFGEPRKIPSFAVITRPNCALQAKVCMFSAVYFYFPIWNMNDYEPSMIYYKAQFKNLLLSVCSVRFFGLSKIASHTVSIYEKKLTIVPSYNFLYIELHAKCMIRIFP